MAPAAASPKPAWPVPRLLFKVNDMDSPGARKFFKHVNPSEALHAAVLDVFVWLYTAESVPRHVRSVTLILRSMDGVAYTTGSDLDEDHKEIHFSTDYIANVSDAQGTAELKGVITHEMVHCFQYNALGTCPGGLIEGVADYVRLRAGYVPPHWHRGGERWDEGYQNTGYFLDYLERKHGEGTVRAINACLAEETYDDAVFKKVCGHSVDKLWKRYKKWVAGDPDDEEKETSADKDRDEKAA
ncbi:plant basic secretory protein [Exidia glandulosa HHB12029]|uniref:Plant basic secretory protein n=1 Tax=Exidia glandulosa HHB12029 TaxID=1314781 RepID=A0A165CUR6_EXIGL|nr:plant basic secretory protein [Exidia glandulosa HHB12029]KZV93739.1 plant basic secretory protein [Exidia glandulosa HHB12029]